MSEKLYYIEDYMCYLMCMIEWVQGIINEETAEEWHKNKKEDR